MRGKSRVETSAGDRLASLGCDKRPEDLLRPPVERRARLDVAVTLSQDFESASTCGDILRAVRKGASEERPGDFLGKD